MKRIEDLCYGSNFCNSFLNTAPGSTFAWWISYLASSNTTIYYNSNFTNIPHNSDNFLTEWIPLNISY